MDLSTAIPVVASVVIMGAASRIIYIEKLKSEREKRRELIIENAKLCARINAMTTDQRIACGAAVLYDDMVKEHVASLEQELRHKDQLLRQKWRNAV